MNQSKNDRLPLNMATYALLQIVNMLVGIFLPRLFLAAYGSEINGIISTVNSFVSYFSYLEAGLGLTLIHSLFKPLANQDTDKINGVLSYSNKQYKNISYIYFALVVALSLIFPLIKGSDALGSFEFISLVFVIGAYGAVDFYTMAKYRVLLTADRKEYIISGAMIIAQLIRFVFVWLLLSFKLSVVLVKIVPIITLLVRSIILKLYVKKYYKEVDFSAIACENIPASKHRWDALLLQISITTSISLPTIIVSQVLGYKEANVYAIYSLIASSMISIVSSLSSGVSPMLGRNIAMNQSINKIYDMYDFIVTVTLSVVFSTMSVMTISFVRIYTNVVSDVNYIYPIYALLFSLFGALYSYRIPITAVINAAAIYRENRINNIINLLIQLVLGIACTLIFGIPGLLVALILSSVHRNISLTTINNKVLLKGNIYKSVVRQLVMILTITASFLIGNYIFSINDINFIQWIAIAILTVIIECFLCLLIYTVIDINNSKEAFSFIKSKIKSLLKNRNKEISNDK